MRNIERPTGPVTLKYRVGQLIRTAMFARSLPLGELPGNYGKNGVLTACEWVSVSDPLLSRAGNALRGASRLTMKRKRGVLRDDVAYAHNLDQVLIIRVVGDIRIFGGSFFVRDFVTHSIFSAASHTPLRGLFRRNGGGRG